MLVAMIPRMMTTKTKHDFNAKQRDAEADTTTLEQEIDRLVDELYGLTDDEIKLVEESGQR